VAVNNSVKVGPLVFLLQMFVIVEKIVKRPVLHNRLIHFGFIHLALRMRTEHPTKLQQPRARHYTFTYIYSLLSTTGSTNFANSSRRISLQ
jgi:hypothetical protein